MASSCEDMLAPSAAMAAAASPATSAPATLTLRARLARAVSEFSSQIAEAGGGALVQVRLRVSVLSRHPCSMPHDWSPGGHGGGVPWG